MPGFSRITQARFSGPRGRALQFSANAVDENAADKPINAKPILSVVITGLVSIFAGPTMGIPPRGIKLPNIATVQRPHDADARHHGGPVEIDDQEEGF